MKILHFSTWQTGGAAKAAIRLSAALSKHGYDSKVIHMPTRLPAYLDAAIGKLAQDHNPIIHSYNFFPDNFKKVISQEKPDIIHLHWIGAGFIRPESLQDCPVPIVWTLHDLWPLLGGEHLPPLIGPQIDQTRMHEGYLSTNRPASDWGFDLNRLVWNRKKHLLETTFIQFIAPSLSVYHQARSANIINPSTLIHIPNFIDSTIYSPDPTQLVEPFTVLFPAMNAELDPNKGLDLLFTSLSELPHAIKSKIIVRLAGISSLPSGIKTENLKIELLGVVSDEMVMAQLYRQSSLVVVPSRMENLPYTIMESLACGTPVVAFRVGGIPELVIHGITGSLAPAYDTTALSREITKILSSQVLRAKLSINAIRQVKDNFAEAKIIKAHTKLYNSLVNR